MDNGIAEIRAVFERIGSDVAELPDGEMLSHASSALIGAQGVVSAVVRIWKPTNIDTLSEGLRVLADMAEIGEERTAAEQENTDA